jgi:hypothetical protein
MVSNIYWVFNAITKLIGFEKSNILNYIYFMMEIIDLTCSRSGAQICKVGI